MILKFHSAVFEFSGSFRCMFAQERVTFHSPKRINRKCSGRSWTRNLACVLSADGASQNVDMDFIKAGRTRVKSFFLKNAVNELESKNLSKESIEVGLNATDVRDDHVVDSRTTEFRVIHSIPSRFINNCNVGLFAFFFIFGVLFDKLWKLTKKSMAVEGLLAMRAQVPAGFSLFLEKDLKRKESVEWVNMVIEKLWKVYRNVVENSVIETLQSVIDDLEKPEYVTTVEIEQFSLGDEPLSVRNVERITSRCINDLQYQIGIRYTGGAHMLLTLSLKFGIVRIALPINVSGFDIEGELWVKLRLIHTEPWVGSVSWAFVSLPKIKILMSPFRLFNLMEIPVLSPFLTKLLTQDLLSLFVLPNKNVLDFEEGEAIGIDSSVKSSEIEKKLEDFVGELSVTLVNARKVSYFIYGKTDPYVTFNLGDQCAQSKRNSQTSVNGPPGEPIWNQDFHFLVSDPKMQKLFIHAKDSIGFTDLTVGSGAVDLGSLQDTVTTDRAVVLQRDWGPFSNIQSGEIFLRLTYKAYVEDEDYDKTILGPTDIHASDKEQLNFNETNATSNQDRPIYSARPDRESTMDVLAALLASREFQQIIASETTVNRLSDYSTSQKTSSTPLIPSPKAASSSSDQSCKVFQVSGLFWLAAITSVSALLAMIQSMKLVSIHK